jgi:predicted MFS family arabinose efflux permease
MKTGLAVLAFAYVLSQFFRAFLAVLAPVLQTDLGVSPSQLSYAAGLWFISFAALQIPVGWALDTVGPRLTSSLLLLLGGAGGALIFAFAGSGLHINIAMLLIGIGCSPVLMSSYYIFARQFPPVQFATLASLMVGVGMLGNLVASYPMAFAADTIGWRASLIGLAGLCAVTALGLWLTVTNPPALDGGRKGSILELLRLPALWTIFPLMAVAYAPIGAMRGLWAGPYLSDVFAADTKAIGVATLLMGLAMIAGTLTYGPLDRLLGRRRTLIITGSAICAASMLGMAAFPDRGFWFSTVLLSAMCFFGSSFAVILAHGRTFLPPYLLGRGVTLLNLFGIGGVGLLQFASGRLHASFDTSDPVTPYVALMLLFSAALLFGLFIYLFSPPSRD